MKKMTRSFLLGLLAVLVVLQFFQIDKTNPPAVPGKDFIAIENPPAEVGTMLKNACYDCHSNQTAYPWYTYIQPTGWWIKGHINGGRKHLNYSAWADLSGKDRSEAFEEMLEVVKEGEMPLKSYTWGHPEARLSNTQRQALATWFGAKHSGKATPADVQDVPDAGDSFRDDDDD